MKAPSEEVNGKSTQGA